MSSGQKAIVYQLVIRYFGNTNTNNQNDGSLERNGCGKFADVNEAAIHSLADLGVTHIWLTGCLRQATLTSYPELNLPADDPDIVKGRAGSFYAVRDYFDVCPDYALDPAARMAEFEALVDRIHSANLKVLIDFVPNHVARSYDSVVRPDLNFGSADDQSAFFARDNAFFYLVDPPNQQLRLSHPEYWKAGGATFDGVFELENGEPGRVPKATGDASKFYTTPSPSETDWYEAVKLNYGFNYVDESGHYDPAPLTWTVMDQVLAFWQSKGVDGFRCDMAHLVPSPAWKFLIEHARAEDRNPDVFFLAEAYVGSNPYDPVKSFSELLDCGFDAVYHDNSYNRLTDLFRGYGSQDAYNQEMLSLGDRERVCAVEYLENHDKPRAVAVFGSPEANYLLAPLQFLYSGGPAILLNGQEVGEPGAGEEGFSRDRGRTTFFDYWCMPEFAKWVNGHAYDGACLSAEQSSLRKFFSDLLNLCQDEAVCSDGYWGLKYFNRNPDDLYSFARYSSGRLLLVVANFRPAAACAGQMRVPAELLAAANVAHSIEVRTILTRAGSADGPAFTISSEAITQEGLRVELAEWETKVFLITGL